VKVLSLFSGGGGLDMAAEMLWPDLEHVAFVENDRHASSVLAHHWPDVPNLGDVTAVDWSGLGQVDVVLAGFPCQDISQAGKRRGITEGTRSGLWFRVADAIRVLRPRLVLLENVAAIASPGGGVDVVAGSLAKDGWDAEWGVLRASDVGAPHGRARWFCVACPGVDGLEGTKSAGRHVVPAGCGSPQSAADSSVNGWSEGRTRSGQRPRGTGQLASDRCAAADSDGGRLTEYGEQNGRPDQPGIETPRRDDTHRLDTDWGDYAPAIERWAAILGRPAPTPTDA